MKRFLVASTVACFFLVGCLGGYDGYAQQGIQDNATTMNEEDNATTMNEEDEAPAEDNATTMNEEDEAPAEDKATTMNEEDEAPAEDVVSTEDVVKAIDKANKIIGFIQGNKPDVENDQTSDYSD